MNKIFTFIIDLIKGSVGFFIYLLIEIIFAYLITSIPNISIKTYELLMILMEFITLALLVLLHRKRLVKDFRKFSNKASDSLSLGVKTYLIALFFMAISNLIINNYIVNGIAANEAGVEAVVGRFPYFTLIGIIMIGPFTEEMIFRLGYYDNFKSKKAYYIVSTLLFAGMHVLNGMSSYIELLYFIPYGIMAYALCRILDKSDNIFTSTIIHTMHNMITIILICISTLMGA